MPHDLKLAILVDPDEIYPPSNQASLNYLKNVAEEMKLKVQFVTKKNVHSLNNYSALFLRTITNKNNYTYQWVVIAEYLKLKMIDSSHGITLATDKHLQYELAKLRNIRIPKTKIIHIFDDIDHTLRRIHMTFPLVLKIPNGSFSNGVYKVHDIKELKNKAKYLFHKNAYDSLILQEYMYTEYDWRIGVLDRKPLFVCQYYMAENHWKIIKYKGNKIIAEGRFETLPIFKTPKKVLDCAYAVSSLLDRGLYGIDIKVYKNKAYLIEINDNPNICFDIEDIVNREKLYRKIVKNLIDE